MWAYRGLITAACIEDRPLLHTRVPDAPLPFPSLSTCEIRHCESVLPDMTDDTHNHYGTGYQRYNCRDRRTSLPNRPSQSIGMTSTVACRDVSFHGTVNSREFAVFLPVHPRQNLGDIGHGTTERDIRYRSTPSPLPSDAVVVTQPAGLWGTSPAGFITVTSESSTRCRYE